jgi:adenylate cyclase class 2
MPKEIETKFKISSPAAFKRSLTRLNVAPVSKKFEGDIYYSGLTCKNKPEVIRLRSIGRKGIFTLKFRVGQRRCSAYKVCDEFEVEVNDVKAFGQILATMGFVPIFRKEKIRETYRWKDVLILVDELPYLGSYVEIEGPKGRIAEVARRLGLKMSKGISKTYIELFNEYKKRHKDPGLELVFVQKKIKLFLPPGE